MTTGTVPQTVLFPDLFDKPLFAKFNQEQASSDGGAVLLKAAERVYGLVKAFARCLSDKRAPEKIRHTLADLGVQTVSRIQARAVRRGPSRRPVAASSLVGVDERSLQRPLEYVNVISDLTTSEPCVVVATGRDRGSLDGTSRRSANLGGSRSRRSRGWQERHTDGVIDAVVTNITNARSDATNAKIQWIKRLGCGYRNRERFPHRHLLSLRKTRPLYPDALVAHTKPYSICAGST